MASMSAGGGPSSRADLANEGLRVLAVYERGASGSRVVDQARELMQAHGEGPTVVTPAPRDTRVRMTVVTLAPRDTRVRGTGVSARDFNEAVRDSAQRELDEARLLFGSLAERVAFDVVFEGGDASLARWAADGGFDVILLPARRRLFSRKGHPLAAALRESTAADVRVVGA